MIEAVVEHQKLFKKVIALKIGKNVIGNREIYHLMKEAGIEKTETYSLEKFDKWRWLNGYYLSEEVLNEFIEKVFSVHELCIYGKEMLDFSEYVITTQLNANAKWYLQKEIEKGITFAKDHVKEKNKKLYKEIYNIGIKLLGYLIFEYEVETGLRSNLSEVWERRILKEKGRFRKIILKYYKYPTDAFGRFIVEREKQMFFFNLIKFSKLMAKVIKICEMAEHYLEYDKIERLYKLERDIDLKLLEAKEYLVYYTDEKGVFMLEYITGMVFKMIRELLEEEIVDEEVVYEKAREIFKKLMKMSERVRKIKELVIKYDKWLDKVLKENSPKDYEINLGDEKKEKKVRISKVRRGGNVAYCIYQVGYITDKDIRKIEEGLRKILVELF